MQATATARASTDAVTVDSLPHVVDLSRLDRKAKRELLMLLEERQRRYSQRLFYELYPDDDQIWTGPQIQKGLIASGQVLHSRHKYPKHMEFFASGRMYRERCAMCANRCLTAETVIDTPDGPRMVADLYRRGEPFRVWSWNGQRRVIAEAEAPFQKPGRPGCYRITMDDGTWFECSGEHRILTESGAYVSVQRLLASGAIPLASSLGRARSTHGEGDPRSTRIVPGSLAGCSRDCRPDGGQPRAAQDIGRSLLPSPAGVPVHSRLSWLADALARRCTSSLSAVRGHLSILDADDLIAALFAGFAGRSVGTISAPCFETRHTGLQLPGGSMSLLRPDGEVLPNREDLSEQSCAPPMMINANRIVSCHSIGAHEVYDFTVPDLHNYITAGIVHHNTGKTLAMGAYETAAHLTGEYPVWWEGRRFDHPVSAWAAGKGFETTRDIMQLSLLGEVAHREGRKTVDGRGVIPGHLLGQPTWKSGVADLVDTVHIRHASGGWSDLGFKSYEQGRGSFEGTGKSIIWFDEEPPLSVYGEALMRTATVGGIIYITFTPLEGMSEVVLQFMPADQRPEMLN